MSPFWLYQPLPNTFLLLSAHLVTGMEKKNCVWVQPVFFPLILSEVLEGTVTEQESRAKLSVFL